MKLIMRVMHFQQETKWALIRRSQNRRIIKEQYNITAETPEFSKLFPVQTVLLSKKGLLK